MWFVGVFYGSTKNGGTQFALQLYAVVVSVVWSAVCTLAILLIVDFTIGLRVTLEAEQIGLDMAHHRESIGSSSAHSDRLQRSMHSERLQRSASQQLFQAIPINQSTKIVMENRINNSNDDNEASNFDGITMNSIEAIPQRDSNEDNAVIRV